MVLWQEKLLFKQLTWVRFPADAGLITFKGTYDSIIVPPTDVTSPRLVSTRCSNGKDG